MPVVQPLISIGIPTYRRLNLLRETLQSVYVQDMKDVEILIGNNDAATPLSANLLGVNEPNLRILNHPENLGQVKNMNLLLEKSRGKYFAWLNDDDLYATEFLRFVRQAIFSNTDAGCVFSGFHSGTDAGKFHQISQSFRLENFSSSEFLENFLSKKLKTIGCYGVFEKERLLNMGGITAFSKGIAYADQFLGIQSAGYFDEILYINSPLIFFRAHSGSISYASGDSGEYLLAQKELAAASGIIFSRPVLAPQRRTNLYLLFKMFVSDYIAVLCRSQKFNMREFGKFIAFVMSGVGGGRYRILIGFEILYAIRRELWGQIKQKARVLFMPHARER